MSSANVEAIERVYERWERDRTIDVDAFDPDFEIRTPLMELEDRTRHGAEGFREWREANEEVFSDDWFEVGEIEDLGERVLVSGWIRLRGRTSGIDTRQPAVQLWTFRDGKPASLILARSRAEALEEAGPAE